MTVSTAPCGDTFDTEADAKDHAATCGACAGAEEQPKVAAPCGTLHADATLMGQHAATCSVCREYAQAFGAKPQRRTITARREAATEARSALIAYGNTLSDEPSAFRVRRLSWALAHIERALYHETTGRYGRAHATGKDALERQANR